MPNSGDNFKVLAYDQKFMNILGIHSYNLNDPTNEFFKSAASYHVLTFEAIGLVGSLWYFFTNLSNLKSAFGALKVAIAGGQVFGMFFSIGMKMKQIKALHLRLQEIVDKNKRFYWTTEQNCRKRTSKLAWYILLHNATLLCGLGYALWCIANGNYDWSAWMKFFDIRIPFVHNTTIYDWFIMWFMQFNMCFSYAAALIAIITYFINGACYVSALCDHFNMSLSSIGDDAIQTKPNFLSAQTIQDQTKKQLSDAIKFHIEILEVFGMLIDIHSGAIFSLLPANVLVLSTSLFDFEEGTSDLMNAAMLFNVSCIVSTLVWPLVMTYFATMASSRIESISDTVYQLNWYHFPPKLQKYLIIIFARCQEPVYFNGLNLFDCTLEIFANLFKASCSYYIMFRTFAHR